MKKLYSSPEMTCVKLNVADVIATSALSMPGREAEGGDRYGDIVRL